MVVVVKMWSAICPHQAQISVNTPTKNTTRTRTPQELLWHIVSPSHTVSKNSTQVISKPDQHVIEH